MSAKQEPVVAAAAAPASTTPAAQQSPQLTANGGGASELVEVKEAMREAVAVFNKVKTEKMTSEAPNAPESHLLGGVPKEIVDKAFKQKERERANRASAAASRNKVMRYQIELEARLNRVEAERNALRKELCELRSISSSTGGPQHAADLAVSRAVITKVRHAQADALGQVVSLAEIDAFLGGNSTAIARTMGIPTPELLTGPRSGQNTTGGAARAVTSGHAPAARSATAAAVAAAAVSAPRASVAQPIAPAPASTAGPASSSELTMAASPAAASAPASTSDVPAAKKTRRS